MKRLAFIIVATVAAMILAAQAAQAAPASYVSGPTGTQVNGWYTGLPTHSATVEIIATCPLCDSTNPNATSPYGISPQTEGKHHVTISSDANGNLQYVDENGPYGFGGVQSGGPYDTVVWTGSVWNDWSPPSVTVSDSRYPQTTDVTQVVTGTVTDSASGVDGVTVNGVKASVSGSTYSATVPIDLGDNTLSIVATDNAGHKDTASATVFRRDLTVAEATGQTPAPTQAPATQQAPAPAPTDTASAAPTPTDMATPAASVSPTPTDSGIAVATTGQKSSPPTQGIVVGVVIFLVAAGAAYGFGRGWLKKVLAR